MPNFQLIGFEEAQKRVLCEIIRREMTMLGLGVNDAVITIMPYDHRKTTTEVIRLYGFSDSALGLDFFPDDIPMETVSSSVETLGGELAPYAEVCAYTREQIEEIAAHMRQKHFGYAVEKRLVPPEPFPLEEVTYPSVLGELEYPCVRIISDGVMDLFDVSLAIRKLGVEWIYPETICGFASAEEMR
jgi:hypothetical protein